MGGDAKYGRLFTEREVRGLVVSAASDAMGIAETLRPDEFASRLIDEMAAPTFPADEPLFLLRGQDAYAPSAVQDYLNSLSTPLKHRLAVEVAADAMIVWQRENPGRVKVPD